MAVFTACVPEHCRSAMEHLGLTPYFERVIYAQELGVDKKSPAIFRRVARSWASAPGSACSLTTPSPPARPPRPPA